MTERVFHTLAEVKEAYFPHRTYEELEGESTEEQIQTELRRFVEIAKKNSGEAGLKKAPR